MSNYLIFFQIFVSILLIITILLQTPGAGLGTVFGGGGEFYRSKRGMEKIIFYLTIGLAILFLLTSILSLTI